MFEVVSLRRVLSSLVAMALVVATVPMAAVADEVGKEDVGSPTETIVSASSSDGSVSGAEGSETEDAVTGDAASAEQEAQLTASSKEGLEGGSGLESESADSAPVAAESADSTPATDDNSLLQVQKIDPSFQLKSVAASKKITTIGGATRFETSEAQALSGWSSSEWAIVASGYSYADSICGSGLAGALNCPILLTDGNSLSSTARNVISRLGVKYVIVLGGTEVISEGVVSQLGSLVGEKPTRLAGQTRFETQMAIYDYGVKHGCWESKTAIIAYGWNFADALSVSPVAYKLKAPIFFADGDLPAVQRNTLLASSFSNFVITGGKDVVRNSVSSQLGSKGSVVRLGGDTRYETSIAIAKYAVSNCGMTWDGMAFTSGQVPFDALGGGALQGSRNSVLVLKNQGDTTGANVPSGANPSTYVYFGGSAVYPDAYKVLMAKRSGFDIAQIDGASVSVNGSWYYIAGQTYYWNGSDWTRGWANIGGTRLFYYSSGAMVTGWHQENGLYYDFGSNGVLVPTHYHNIEWAGQPNNYYCGPTSGYMVLRNVGAWTSAWGDGLNIWNVARYMHTDNYGYTSFQDRWFSRGMNDWLARNVYTSVHTPSYETVRNAIMGSYVNGYATVLDEQERRGGPHFNGHNNGTFAHIMVVDGYNENTDAVYICDPGAPVLWPSGSGHFWYGSLREFVQTYMQSEINGARERIGVHYAWY